ncbi:MAG: hypothetical protein ACJAXN_002845 [Psychromonas sp.]
MHEKENTLTLSSSNLTGVIYRARISDYKILFITDGCQNLLGYSASRYLSGQRNLFIPFIKTIKIFKLNTLIVLLAQKKYEYIFRIQKPIGEWKRLIDQGSAIQQDNDEVYLEGILLDTNEYINPQQQVEYLTARDPLTGLTNRYLFNNELVNYINRYRDNTRIALL